MPAGNTTIKNIFANILLFIFGTVIALVLLEVALRVFEPFEFRVRGNEITLPSNVQYITENELANKLDRTIIHTKNSLGFRGDDPPAQLDNVLSIIAVGGSTTESAFQSDDREWVHLLGQQLKQSFDPLWINNAGLDGHSTFGHQILMRDLIRPLKPKTVLFLVGINEVGRDDMIINEQKYQDRINTDSLPLFILSLANKSEVLTLGVNIFRYLKARKAGITHNTQLDLADESKREIHLNRQDRERILATHRQKYIPAYRKRIEQLVQYTVSTGTTPVLITQPALYGPVIDDVTGVDLGKLRLSDEMDGALAWDVLELYNDVTRSTAAEHGLLLIDLATSMPKSSSLFYDFAHYTNQGAETVARIIYNGLCPWLASNYADYQHAQCITTAEQ